jgi:predicted dehydrogenase
MKGNEQSDGIERRGFLKTGGLGAAALVAAASAPHVARAVSPTADPVRLGHIGLGVRGGQLIDYTGVAEGAKVVAVCDVYKPHLQKGVERSNNPDVKAYDDYHGLLSDPKVEAVVIATPDHWHERMLLEAIAAGKDVYCEKGWTMSMDSAKRMRAAVKKNNTVMQLGHQGRQHPASRVAGDLIRAGELGEVTLVHTGRYFNGTPDKAPWRWYGWYSDYEHPDPKEVAKQVNWERWLGDLPTIEWNERHFWHWRCYWRYGTGQAGDLLSHEMDYVQAVLGYGIPDNCMCSGLNAFYKDDREVPDTWMATYQFEKQNCTATFQGCMNSRRLQTPEFIGRTGRIIFNGIGQDATRFERFEDGPAYTMANESRPEPIQHFAPGKDDRQPNHMDDFLNCVRTREKPRCNEDEAFIETATILMSVQSYHQRRMVRWDSKREVIV